MNDDTAQATEIPLAPMIDCVFLLLIYFLLSAALLLPEVDHPVSLPAGSSATTLPEELIVELTADGTAVINGTPYGNATGHPPAELNTLLYTLAGLSHRHNQPCPVILLPDPATPHDAVTRMISLCHDCGLHNVTFGKMTSR